MRRGKRYLAAFLAAVLAVTLFPAVALGVRGEEEGPEPPLTLEIRGCEKAEDWTDITDGQRFMVVVAEAGDVLEFRLSGLEDWSSFWGVAVNGNREIVGLFTGDEPSITFAVTEDEYYQHLYLYYEGTDEDGTAWATEAPSDLHFAPADEVIESYDLYICPPLEHEDVDFALEATGKDCELLPTMPGKRDFQEIVPVVFDGKGPVEIEASLRGAESAPYPLSISWFLVGAYGSGIGGGGISENQGKSQGTFLLPKDQSVVISIVCPESYTPIDRVLGWYLRSKEYVFVPSHQLTGSGQLQPGPTTTPIPDTNNPPVVDDDDPPIVDDPGEDVIPFAMKPLSRQESKDLYEKLVAPSVAYDYDADIAQDGRVSEEGLRRLVEELNYRRRLAGSAPVELDARKSSLSQAATDYMSANKVFGHHVADESDDEAAKAGLQQSNLACGTGTLGTPRAGIRSCFLDSDGNPLSGLTLDSNTFSAGHRRWLVAPSLKTIGIGYTGPTETNEWGYTAMHVLDAGAPNTAAAFPGIGAVPVELAEGFDVWSVNLPSGYDLASGEELDFSITREDGEAAVLSFGFPDPAGDWRVQDWCAMQRVQYGSSNAVMFSPASLYSDPRDRDSADLEGHTYTFCVEGLQDTEGEPVVLKYETTFFSLDDELEPEPESNLELSVSGPGGLNTNQGVSVTIKTNAAWLEGDLEWDGLESISVDDEDSTATRLLVADGPGSIVYHAYVPASSAAHTVGLKVSNVRYRMTPDAEARTWDSTASWKAPVACGTDDIPLPEEKFPALSQQSKLELKEVDGQELLTGISLAGPVAKRTVGALLADFTGSSGSVRVLNSDGAAKNANDCLCTGDILERTSDRGAKRSSVVVVAGDICGTGENSLMQLVKLARGFLGSGLATAQRAAGDWDGNGQISITDIVMQASLLLAVVEPEVPVTLTGTELDGFLADVCAPLALMTLLEEEQTGVMPDRRQISQQDAEFWMDYLEAVLELRDARTVFGNDAVLMLMDPGPSEEWQSGTLGHEYALSMSAVREYIQKVFDVDLPDTGSFSQTASHVIEPRDDDPQVTLPDLTELTADAQGNVSLDFLVRGEEFGNDEVHASLNATIARDEDSPYGARVVSFAVESSEIVRPEPGPTVTPDPDLTPASSSNKDMQEYSGNWSHPIKSYLVDNGDAGFTRVECVGDELIVEEYSPSFEIQSGFSIPLELERWGGFYSGDKYNYVIVGQNNPEESDSTEVIRVVQYDKDWKRLGAASVRAANICSPFEAGTLRCTEAGDYLYVHTSRTMYESSDGANHQSSLTFSVDQRNCELTSMHPGVSQDIGYVSHSFNQFSLVGDDGHLVNLDHGDAYPRALQVVRYGAEASSGELRSEHTPSNKLSLVEFPGAIAENKTGCCVGGFEKVDGGYLVAYAYDGTARGGEHDLYLCRIDEALSTSRLISCTRGSNVGNPQMVSTGPDGGYVLYIEEPESGGSTFKYLRYDKEGAIGAARSADAKLSDCKPIWKGGKAVWYVTDGSVPTFYTLDESGVRAVPVESSEAA